MTKQVFEVEGSGFFPIDMLRYDSCWPYSQEDVSGISCTYELQPMRRVKLCRIVRNKNLMPTGDRWASFGWTFLPRSIELYPFPSR